MPHISLWAACIVHVAFALGAMNAPAQNNESLDEINKRYEAEVAEQQWAEAFADAERAVALLRSVPDSSSSSNADLVSALTRLGFARAALNDWLGAEGSYAEAAKIAEASFGSADQRLLEPLRGLGKALCAQNKHEQAIPVLENALRISLRSDGIFSLTQADLLKLLADAQTAVGQYTAAEQTFKYFVQAHEREYGEQHPLVLPVRAAFAEWYVYVGEIELARSMMREDIQVAETKLGKNAPALIWPLRALARSYLPELMYGRRIVGTLPDKDSPRSEIWIGHRVPGYVPPQWLDDTASSPIEGERALQRALSIAQADSTSINTRELMLELGDWFMFKHRPKKALDYYKRAVAYGESAKLSTPSRAQPVPLLGQPETIFLPTLKSAKSESSEPRFVLIEYSVTPNGEAEDARVLEGTATEKEKTAALNAVKAALFRPRFENGESVRTDGQRYRLVFK